MRRLPPLVVAMLVGLTSCGFRTGGSPAPVRPAVRNQVPVDALPTGVRDAVLEVPSLCLVARDPSETLMTLRGTVGVDYDPGFMAVPEVGRPDYGLAPGVDSVALAGQFILVGCNPGADMGALVTKAFADATRRGVTIELWEKTKTGWVIVSAA